VTEESLPTIQYLPVESKERDPFKLCPGHPTPTPPSLELPDLFQGQCAPLQAGSSTQWKSPVPSCPCWTHEGDWIQFSTSELLGLTPLAFLFWPKNKKVLGFELRAYTLRHSTSPLFDGFFFSR
jgi:hypothetical protein